MAREELSLQGKVIAITGGARGIGKATAKALTREGARVAIGDLDRELSEAAAAEIGGETIGLELDVTSRESFAGFLGQVEERLGSLYGLVNNAGIMPLGRFVEEDDATARRQVEINLHGVLYGMKLALPGMIRRGDGHIVNIASQAGKTGLAGGATYCATKFAVVGVSEAVRGELRDTGVEISCVMPAVVATELGSGLVEARGVKVSTPEEVAEAIVAAFKRPILEVHVPKVSAVINRVVRLLPQRGQDALARAFKADQVLMGADHAGRAGYEQRAARSAPASDAVEEAAAEEREEAVERG